MCVTVVMVFLLSDYPLPEDQSSSSHAQTGIILSDIDLFMFPDHERLTFDLCLIALHTPDPDSMSTSNNNRPDPTVGAGARPAAVHGR